MLELLSGVARVLRPQFFLRFNGHGALCAYAPAEPKRAARRRSVGEQTGNAQFASGGNEHALQQPSSRGDARLAPRAPRHVTSTTHAVY